MSGKSILEDVIEELENRRQAETGYDNYTYPDSPDSYDDNDSDDSDSEKG